MKKIVLLHIILAAFSGVLMAQTPPVQGDELIDLIGQRKTNVKVQRLLDFIGDNGPAKGITMTLIDNRVEQIDLYSDKKFYGAEYNMFKGKLPKGLSFSNTIHQSKMMLGEGFEFEGEVAKAYYLFKQYDLNGKDAVTINVDYQKGEINTVSLVLEEGGAAEFDQEGNVNETGIEGDDFLSMIKKNTGNLTVRRLFEQWGYADHSERKLKIFTRHGFEMRLNENNQIDFVGIYSGGQKTSKGGTFEPFKLPIPYGIRFEDNKQMVMDKAGPPVKSGNTLVYHEGYTVVEVFFSGGTVSYVELTLNEEIEVERPSEARKNALIEKQKRDAQQAELRKELEKK